MLLILVFVALIANIIIALKSANTHMPSSNPTIPFEFMRKYPNCTNKLLETMNITRIHLVPPGTIESRLKKRTDFRSQNLSE